MEIFTIFTALFGLVFFGNTTTLVQEPIIDASPAVSSVIESSSVEPASDIVENADVNVEILAQCLSKKGAVMYGAFWCPHCQSQKKLFGDDFQFITYQECDAKGPGGNPQVCKAQGITGYPTWKFPNHEDLIGEQSFAKLAEAANCPIN